MQEGKTVLKCATGDPRGMILAFTSGKLKPVADWLDQPSLELLPYFPSLFDKLGVKFLGDLPGVTVKQLEGIGMKPIDITRFIAAAKALKVPSSTAPSSAAAAGSIHFEPRVFPTLGASKSQKAGHGEALATMHMRALGFHDAVVSGCAKRSEFPTDWDGLLPKAIAYVDDPDGGIDICASGAVAQVKSVWSEPIGEPLMRDLFGAASNGHSAKRRLFYASHKGYTAQAAAYADGMRIALFTFTDQGVVTPVNDVARELVSAAGGKRKRPAAPTGSCLRWSKEEVQQWLESCGFEAFAGSFSIVDGSDLKGLTADDLSTLQPPIVGFPAKKLLQAIKQLEPIEL